MTGVKYLYKLMYKRDDGEEICTATVDLPHVMVNHVVPPHYVEVVGDGDPDNTITYIRSPNELLGWETARERDIWKEDRPMWDEVELFKEKPEKASLQNTNINPRHYKGYVAEYQWWETIQYRYHQTFEAVSLVQIDKYLGRFGKKDEELQELLKALWYLKFLIAFKINGREPIRIKDVDKIIESYKV